MNRIITDHFEELTQLCKLHHVESLYIFGSVNTDAFNAQSDIDFLVVFGQVNPYDYFDNFMDFKESLEKLFTREVDLVEEKTVKNPILRNSIENGKLLIYGRAS